MALWLIAQQSIPAIRPEGTALRIEPALDVAPLGLHEGGSGLLNSCLVIDIFGTAANDLGETVLSPDNEGADGLLPGSKAAGHSDGGP